MGFEPTTPRATTWCSLRAELRPPFYSAKLGENPNHGTAWQFCNLTFAWRLLPLGSDHVLLHTESKMKRVVLLSVVALGALLASSCVKHPTEPKEPPPKSDSCCNGTLLIVPYDSVSGEIISGASVRLQKQNGDYSRTIPSDSTGALFTRLCPGTYAIRIATESPHKPCAVREMTITMGCNETKTLRVPIRCERESNCCHGVLIVFAMDSLRMSPPSASGIVRLWRGNAIIQQAELRQGQAAFDGLCPGEYTVEIRAEGYQLKEIPVRLECNEQKLLRLLLSPMPKECCEGKIKVVVRDSVRATALSGVRIRLWKGGAIIAERATDSEGRAMFDQLCKGVYGVSIYAEGYVPKEFVIELGCNQEIERLALLSPREGQCCHGALAILVRDSETGKPVDEAIVGLWAGGTLLRTKETDDDGQVYFGQLCNRRYAISVHHEDYYPFEQSLTLECNEQARLTIALRPR